MHLLLAHSYSSNRHGAKIKVKHERTRNRNAENNSVYAKSIGLQDMSYKTLFGLQNF